MEPQQCWHLLALVAYSLKPVKLLGPCKRTQDCWPTTPNNVGSCWHLLHLFAWAFSDSVGLPRLRNNLGHVGSDLSFIIVLVCQTLTLFLILLFAALLCKIFTILILLLLLLSPTTDLSACHPLRLMQTDPTLLTNNTQHCWAQQCCDLLRPFAWTFT